MARTQEVKALELHRRSERPQRPRRHGIPRTRAAVRAPVLALVCDTGPLFAAVVETDRDHDRCARLLQEWPERLLVPTPVIVEIDWLSNARGLPRVIDVVLEGVEQAALNIEELTRADYARVRSLCRQYGDLPLDFVDAAVVAVAERLKVPTVATLDHRHFTVVRPRHVRSFSLVPA